MGGRDRTHRTLDAVPRLTLLAYLLPLSCLAAWLLSRTLPERFVQRLILVAAVSVLPLHAALVHFHVANPICARA